EAIAVRNGSLMVKKVVRRAETMTVTFDFSPTHDFFDHKGTIPHSDRFDEAFQVRTRSVVSKHSPAGRILKARTSQNQRRGEGGDRLYVLPRRSPLAPQSGCMSHILVEHDAEVSGVLTAGNSCGVRGPGSASRNAEGQTGGQP